MAPASKDTLLNINYYYTIFDNQDKIVSQEPHTISATTV